MRKINAANPKNVVAGDLDGNGIDEVIADFGAGIGIWIRWNGATWCQLHSLTASSMVTGDLDNNGRLEVIVDFPGVGHLHLLERDVVVEARTTRTRRRCSIANIDGGGKDLVLDFPGSGIWILRNAQLVVPSAQPEPDRHGRRRLRRQRHRRPGASPFRGPACGSS